MNLPYVGFSNPLLVFGVIAGLALLLVAVGFWWWLPKREIGRLRPMIFDSAARANAEDNIRKTIGQLLGGAAVLLGAAMAYLQFTQQQQASRNLLISNQVAKGFEQLGSDKPVVRLGGIYALEGVMNTSEEYYQPVLDALSAFVRDATRTATGGERPTTDIQAALTVIGRRTTTEVFRKTRGPRGDIIQVSERIDLSNARIPKSDLSLAGFALVDLSNADLSGASLWNTRLIEADLANADLTEANLVGANLTGARLLGTILTDADLTDAIISQTQLDEACGTNAKLGPGLTLKPCSTSGQNEFRP